MCDTKRRRRPYWIVLAGVALVCAPSLYVLSSGPMQIVGRRIHRVYEQFVDPASGNPVKLCESSRIWEIPFDTLYAPLIAVSEEVWPGSDLLNWYWQEVDSWIPVETREVSHLGVPPWAAEVLATLPSAAASSGDSVETPLGTNASVGTY